MTARPDVLDVLWRAVKQDGHGRWCIVIDHRAAGFKALRPVVTRLEREVAQHIVELHNARVHARRGETVPDPGRPR